MGFLWWGCPGTANRSTVYKRYMSSCYIHPLSKETKNTGELWTLTPGVENEAKVQLNCYQNEARPVYLCHSEGKLCSSHWASLCCRTPPLLFGSPFFRSAAPWTFSPRKWLTGTRLLGYAIHLWHKKTTVSPWRLHDGINKSDFFHIIHSKMLLMHLGL